METILILLKILIIFVMSYLSFGYSLRGEFVFDDTEAILKNSDVTTGSLIDAFKNDFWGTSISSNLSHKSYRPLTIFSFRLNYILSGERLNAMHFKYTNIACHIICCFLIWIAFQKILYAIHYRKTQIDVAYYASLLFAVHPVHVEAVCGSVGRADILSAVTFFATFLVYLKAVERTGFVNYIMLSAVIVLAGIAMLFKENGVTVLGFCIAFEFIVNVKFTTVYLYSSPVSVKKKYKKGPDKWSFIPNTSSIKNILILLVGTFLLLLGRWIIMDGERPVFKPTENPAASEQNIFTKAATYNYIYFLNLLLFIWPQWLCFDWSMGCIPVIRDIYDLRIACIFIMYAYGLRTLVYILFSNNRGTKKLIWLCLSLIIIPFLPASNLFFPVGFVIAERVLYISSAGYCLYLTFSVDQVMEQRNLREKKAVQSTLTSMILLFAMRSCLRSADWIDEYNLFTSGLSVCPLNAKVHYNVAKVVDARNETEWAISEYQAAIRLFPEYYQAMNNLANLLKNQKRYAEAEKYLTTSISLKKDFPAAWMNLGIIYANTGRFDESEKAYKTALQYRKLYPDCYYNLGNLYLENKKGDLAIEAWNQAIQMNPKHVLAWTNLLALLDNTGRWERALELIPIALGNSDDSPSINFVVANICGKLDKFEEAEHYFKKAIHLYGGRVQAIHFANFGVLYHRWKKYALAEEMYKQALKRDPSFKSARKNLESIKNLQSEL